MAEWMIANEQIPKNNFFIYLFLNVSGKRFCFDAGILQNFVPVKLI
jgi:hypothetical protein